MEHAYTALFIVLCSPVRTVCVNNIYSSCGVCIAYFGAQIVWFLGSYFRVFVCLTAPKLDVDAAFVLFPYIFRDVYPSCISVRLWYSLRRQDYYIYLQLVVVTA